MTNDGTTLAPVINALVFASLKHRTQRRKDRDASPYINHPIALADVLVNEAGVTDSDVLCAAILHDTIEDTETTHDELVEKFGRTIADIVAEVSDDGTLKSEKRKALQIEHAPALSRPAKLVKLADKICNLRDVLEAPPANWSTSRKVAYFDWAGQVIDRLRGVHPGLEAIFDQVFRRRIELA